MKVVNNNKETRAESIARMGLVSRIGDRFHVSTPSLRGKEICHEVRRDERGKIRCNCMEFEEFILTDETFRCEHIIAVKFALLAKNTESGLNRSISNSAETNTTKKNTLRSPVTNIRQVDTKPTQTDSRAGKRGKNNMRQPSFKEMSLVSNENPIQFIASNNVMNFPNAVRENFDINSYSTRENLSDRNKNVRLDYSLSQNKVAEILDQSTPNWSHSVRDIKQIGNVVMVIVAVTIDGITREGIGTGLLNTEEGVKKAEQDALTHAAFKFGIARKSHQTNSFERQSSFPSTNSIEFPANPIARSLGDLVTAKQLGMIRAMAREKKIDIEKECQTVMECRTDELSKKAGSALIQHLQNTRPQQQKLYQLSRVS